MNHDHPTAPADTLDRRLLLGAAGLAGIAALAVGRATAGPLNPPAGSVASTGKTLTDVEPRTAVNATNTPGDATYVFRITQSGSYYLTGNISVPAGRVGVFLGAGVRLDLNGFTITGAGGTSQGVFASAGCSIRNGTIASVASAVYVGVSSSTAVYIEDLIVTGFTGRGIDIGGRSVVRRCTVSGAGVTGIEMQGDYGTVEDCTVTNTGGTGVYINAYSVLRRSLLSGCSIGAYVGFGSHVQGCEFSACNNIGLQASQRSAVHGCTATTITVGFGGAAGVGFDLADGAEAVGCAAASCYIGIRASISARIVECTADSCAAAAVKLTGAGNTIEACRLNRSSIGVDMTGVAGNYVHKCVLMGNGNALAVSIGGNWYPNTPISGVNTATNPLASVIG